MHLVFGNPGTKQLFDSITGERKPAYIQELIDDAIDKGAKGLMKRRRAFS
jgi:hypothetical protein